MTASPHSSAQAGKPWLSIMIPAYNVAPYVEECLTSILDQADGGVQIIICDDCSTDDTRSIIDKIAEANAGRLTVIQNAQNVGLSATRNAMMPDAEGEYFWFIDSDDTIRSGAIAAIKRAIGTHQPDIVSGDYHKKQMRKFALHGIRDQYLCTNADILASICEARKMYIWLKISHKDLWSGDLRFPEGKSFEDAAVVPHLALRANTMLHLRKSLINYRVRPGSILAGITRTPDRFNIDKHLDLAHALDGVALKIDAAEASTDADSFDRARRAVSHFSAMEFAKIVQRIDRAGPEGCGVADTQALARKFFAIMDAASPIPFAELVRMYRSRGRFIAAYQLNKALGFIERR